jgi:Kef-type K+ transport system membrane component KefB
MESYPAELLLIAFVAVLAPLLSELPRNIRVPVIVFEVVLGILIGPHVFDLADPDGMVGTLGELGLTFLLFMVGLEIDFDKIRGRPLSLAVGGWLLSLSVALVCMVFFSSIGVYSRPRPFWPPSRYRRPL